MGHQVRVVAAGRPAHERRQLVLVGGVIASVAATFGSTEKSAYASEGIANVCRDIRGRFLGVCWLRCGSVRSFRGWG